MAVTMRSRLASATSGRGTHIQLDIFHGEPRSLLLVAASKRVTIYRSVLWKFLTESPSKVPNSGLLNGNV